MLNRLILKVTKFQLPPPKRLGTVVKNIWGAIMAPPMSNRVKDSNIIGARNIKGAKIGFIKEVRSKKAAQLGVHSTKIGKLWLKMGGNRLN